ncbi:MAG: DUF1441 family protein [Ectothiorhodospiraceae bacterium]|nr:DUF1441 family protein [Ectothiorhodospiraceae bacterium]
MDEALDIPRRRRANKAEVAEFFGVSLPTVDSWIRRGCPVVQTGRRGVSWVLDLRAVAEWAYGRHEDGDVPRQPHERLSYWKAKREEVAYEREVGTLVHVDDARREMAVQATAITNMLDQLPDALERKTGMMPEQLEVVEREIFSLREALYRQLAEVVDDGPTDAG